MNRHSKAQYMKNGMIKCPFCGSGNQKAVIKVRKIYALCGDHYHAMAFMRCECGAEGRKIYENISGPDCVSQLGYSLRKLREVAFFVWHSGSFGISKVEQE